MTLVALSPCLRGISIVALALSLGGCCCGEPQAGLRTLERLTAPTARYVAVQLTLLDEKGDEGTSQVLVEAMVVSAPHGMDIASRMGSSMTASAATIMSEVHNARILQLPSVVTLVGEEATVEVADADADADGDDTALQLLRVSVRAPTNAQSMKIDLSYEQSRNKMPVYSLPRTTIEVVKGQPAVVAVPRHTR